jgi:hypothetical protein
MRGIVIIQVVVQSGIIVLTVNARGGGHGDEGMGFMYRVRRTGLGGRSDV